MEPPHPYVTPGLVAIPGLCGKNPLLLAIANIVSDEFGIPIKEIERPCRLRKTVVARQTWMIAMKEFTDLSLQRIGDIAGGKSHCSVLHGVKRIRRVWIKDPYYGPKILSVIDRIETISDTVN